MRTTLALVLLIATPALADPPRPIPGPIMADVLRVYDGDTMTVRAYIWPGTAVTVNVRVRGIDTPEIRGRCEAEKEAARAARELAAKLAGASVVLTEVETGKYGGRVLATVTTADGPLADQLIAAGLARPYDGGRRDGWCG